MRVIFQRKCAEFRANMRIILFLFLVILILALISISSEILNKKAKFVILLLVALICASVFYYTQGVKNTQNESLELLRAYEQGRSLRCGEYEVNASNFGFEYGTQSFVAKRGAKNYEGVISDIKKCEIKEWISNRSKKSLKN